MRTLLKFIAIMVTAFAVATPAIAQAKTHKHSKTSHGHKAKHKKAKKHSKAKFSFVTGAFDTDGTESEFFTAYDECVFAEMDAQDAADADNEANEDNENWVDPTLGPWDLDVDTCGSDPEPDPDAYADAVADAYAENAGE